jgi:hypothetical protein
MEERKTENRKVTPKERGGCGKKGRKRKEVKIKKTDLDLSLYLIKYRENFALTKETEK